jgi:hypothetical protein
MLSSMLPESFKSDILELIEIAKSCPEPLQARCLEMLLDHYLRGIARAVPPDENETKAPLSAETANQNTSVADEAKAEPGDQSQSPGANGGGDIMLANLHVKARKFLEKYGRTLAELNELSTRTARSSSRSMTISRQRRLLSPKFESGSCRLTEFNLLSFFSDINEIVLKNAKFSVAGS